jgi:transglutaminase-like putative cysteine protease
MKHICRWFGVAALSLGLVNASVTKASTSYPPVSPEDIKMTSEPLALGAPAIILYRQVDRDDSGDYTQQNEFVRIKILTEEGRKYADVEIPFFKDSETITNIHGRTIRPDGSTAEINGQIFEKNLVKGRGVRYLAKTFTMPDVQVGSIIEYSYTIELAGTSIYNSHWILSDDLFTKRAQFSLKPYVSQYIQIGLRWTWNTLPAGNDPPKEDSNHIVRLDAKNIPAFQSEDYEPPAGELKSRVDFIYDAKASVKDENEFWKQTGKSWNETLENFIGKKKAMEHAVAQIVSPGDSQDVKLRKIYDRVQKIRNTSYEVEKSAQEQKRAKEKPPENVEELWKRGYGDGAQLTWLFLGLARAAGFEAYGCWVSNRGEYFFSPTLRDGSKLNSNVVLVKLNGKDVYFDPGAAFTPYGMLIWTETGTPGLRLDKDGGSWINTTLPQAAESQIQRVGRFKLSDTGDLEGKLTVTYTGLEALYHRQETRNDDDVARKKFLEDAVTSQIDGAAQAELTNKPDWTNPEAPLVAEFNLKIPDFLVNAGSRAIIPAAIFTAGEKNLFDHSTRVHPIYFDYPYQKVDDLTLELPDGWHVGTLPSGIKAGQGVVQYSLNAEQGPGSIHLSRQLTIDFLILDQKYYPALRSFFQAVRSGDGRQVILQPGESHAGN